MASDFTGDRNSPKWVLGADGYLKEYIADAAAIEFNADGSYKGVLVEPQSINLCLQSEDLSTTWVSGGTTTVTTNDTVAPDGNTSADKIVDIDNDSTGEVQIYQNITVTANTKYTASIFLKADGLSFASIIAVDYDGTTDGIQFFELSGSGSLGTATNLDDSSIEAYPNGWYRCSITFTQGASDTNTQFRVKVADSISNTIVPLDGTSSIFVWGAQLEESPIATSYIPTTTGAVTRNKDDIYLTSASSLIGQTEGTLFVEVDWRVASGQSQRIMSIVNSGAFSDRIDFYRNGPNDNIRVNIIVDSSEEQNAQSSYTGQTGVKKIAVAYKTSDTKIFLDGSELASTASGDLSNLNLDDINFGQSASQSAQTNMWIRAVALYTTRLSDAECEALTTL